MMRTLKNIQISLLVSFLSFVSNAQGKETTTIAVTQIVSHPSLDKVREGILDALKDTGCSKKETTKIIIDNASGNISIAAQIAQKYASLKPMPNVIIAITTPSAQTVNKAIQGTEIPLIFAGVTNPVGAGLVTSLDKPSEHVTGTIDLPPIEKQLELIQFLLPRTKKIGILYNTGEPNAVYQTNLFTTFAQKDYRVSKVGVSKSADVHQATEKLANDVDAIILFNDNLIISSLEVILKAADGHKVPVFVSDPDSVKRGALAAVANDQYEIGRQTGLMASKLLQGTPLADLPPQKISATRVYTNDKVAKKFKIEIDPSLIKEIQTHFMAVRIFKK